MLSGPGSHALTGEDRRSESGNAILPIDPDVEQVHPEADRDRDG